MYAYVILICGLISVNAESEDPKREYFDVGPFEAKAPFDFSKPVELPKYSDLSVFDALVSNRLFDITKCLALINSQLGYLEPFPVYQHKVFKQQYRKHKVNHHKVYQHKGSKPLTVSLGGVANINGPIQLDNVLIRGLRDLSIDDLEVRRNSLGFYPPGEFRVDVNSSDPLVSLEFDYSVQDHLKHFVLNLTGSVRAKLKHAKSKVTLQVAVKQNADKKFYLDVQRGESEITAENLEVEVIYKSFGKKNEVHVDLVKQIVDQTKTHVAREAGIGLQSYLNNALAILPQKIAMELVFGGVH